MSTNLLQNVIQENIEIIYIDWNMITIKRNIYWVDLFFLQVHVGFLQRFRIKYHTFENFVFVLKVIVVLLIEVIRTVVL